VSLESEGSRRGSDAPLTEEASEGVGPAGAAVVTEDHGGGIAEQGGQVGGRTGREGSAVDEGTDDDLARRILGEVGAEGADRFEASAEVAAGEGARFLGAKEQVEGARGRVSGDTLDAA
jgi:hypothetical protein